MITKQKFIYGLLALMMVFTGFLMYNQAADTAIAEGTAINQKTITVTGEGTVQATPDIAYINIGVQTENVSLEKAQQENKERMNAVYEVFKKYNIAEKDIKTRDFNVYPDYSYDNKTNKRTIRAYIVQNTVEVTVRDISKLGGLIDDVSKNSANRINNIRFDISDTEELRTQALEKALKNSSYKAERMLNVFDIKKLRPIHIEENYQRGYEPIYRYDMAMAKEAESANATPVSAGDMEIVATVSVTYEF